MAQFEIIFFPSNQRQVTYKFIKSQFILMEPSATKINYNESHVTYLLGAGASVGTNDIPSIPAVVKMPDELNKFAEELYKYMGSTSEPFIKSFKKKYPDIPPGPQVNDLQKRIFKLSKKAAEHASIDTYAKKLSIQKKIYDLNELKVLLTLWFTALHKLNPVDPRYDSFFASLINHRSGRFPSHLKILSWNYDLQFELAYAEYFDKKYFSDVHREVNIFPSKFFSPNHDYVSDFFLFKINGTTAVGSNHENNSFYNLLSDLIKFDADTINYNNQWGEFWLKLLYFSVENNNTSAFDSWLNFAWESYHFDLNSRTINPCSEILLGKNAIRQTTDLVVIGYSFPYFNREIDRYLLRDLNLNNVYIQVLDRDMDNVVQAFQSVRTMDDRKIHRINKTDQFFIPPQL